MPLQKKLLFLYLLIFPFLIFAQNQFGVKIPTSNDGNVCQPCNQAIKSKPRSVSFRADSDANNNIFFEVTDKNWLNTFLKGSKDGFMIDIASKERYDCALETLPASKYGLIGRTLPPVWKGKLLPKLKKHKNGRYRAIIGKVPSDLIGKDLEFNIYFIRNNFFCFYSRVYNIRGAKLGLIDSGMFLDTITFTSDIKTKTLKEGFKMKYKTLDFVIPFEKNKAIYSEVDIKPLYDSLRLTDFDIKTIDIKAYSSVEGSTERNLELQNQRASSIANALQSFQKPTIKTSIETTENWVEFFNDIENTPYASFTSLSKKQIKSKLVGATNQKLEPYLKNHRKALVSLELEKKDPYKEMTSEVLYNLFVNAVQEKSLNKAELIQSAIFERIKGNEIGVKDLEKLKVPASKEFAKLANKNVSFSFLINKSFGNIAFDKLKKIEKLLPKNGHIKYNICATQLIIWYNNWKKIDVKKLKNDIHNLKNYGIPSTLVNRLLINYHLTNVRFSIQSNDTKLRESSLKQAYGIYNNVNLSDSDYLNLANYLATFGFKENAVNMLNQRINKIDASEDLLFYYLNLTVTNSANTESNIYRAAMLNAFDKNKKRFCKLFDSYKTEHGITFQLLEDLYLRKMYCENCNK